MASMIDMYANQSIGWRRRTGSKDNGTPIYAPPRPDPPETIKTNVDFSRRLIRDAKGEQVVSEACILTSAKINEGDLLEIYGREWVVLKCNPITGLIGEELHREAYL